MKTPEEMAYDYGEKFDGIQISKNDINIAWYAGFESRQKEINELKANWTFACEDKVRALKELARAERNAQPQWISVKDRLPEDGQGVLVTTGKGGGTTATYFNGDGFYNGHLEDVVITHWMPLPPKPEEEK